MKHIFYAIVLAIVASTAAADINRDCPQFTVTGAPQYQPRPGDQELCRTNYAVIHRCDVRAPVAVFEHLTPAAMSGPAKRKDNFRPDSDVAPQCRATLADYATVGRTHDRGHMSPAANNTQNDAVMSESFLLSNMVAQVANNNRGIWKQLETWTRDWASRGGDFYIVSGGIYDAGHPVTGNGLGIPTRLYKIIVEKTSGQVMAYLMPNTALPVADLPRYQTTVSEVEQATGFQFNFNKLTHR
jgi:endonuclease G